MSDVLFYVERNALLRTDKIYATDIKGDRNVLLYEEKCEKSFLDIIRSTDKVFLSVVLMVEIFVYYFYVF